MANNSEKKLLHAGTVGTVSSLVKSLSLFLGIIALANLLSSRILGIFFLFQAVLGILSIPASAGINGAIEKRISQGEDGSTILGTAVLMKLIILCSLSILIVVFETFINTYMGEELSHLLIIGLFLQEGSRVAQRLLKAEKRIATAHILNATKSVFWTTAATLLAFTGFGIEAIVYVFLAGYFIVASVGGYIQQVSIGKFTRSSMSSIIQYSKYNVVTTIGGTIYGRMDTAMLALFVNPSFIAAYEVAWRISKVGLTISQSVAVTTFPQISEWSADNEYAQISNTVSESIIASVLVVIPAFFGVLLFSSEILNQLYGPEYIIASVAFVILSFERIVKAPTQIFSRCLHALDRPDLSAQAALIAISTNIILNLIMIQYIGITGAAIATATSFGLKSSLEYRYLNNLIPIAIPRQSIRTIIISSMTMFLLLLILKTFVYIESVLTLTGMIILGVLCYFGILLISPAMRDRTLAVIRQINAMIRIG